MVGYGLKVFLDVVSLQTYLLTHGQNKCPNDSYSEKTHWDLLFKFQKLRNLTEWYDWKLYVSTDVINITSSQVVPSMTEVEGSTLTMSVEINIRFEFEVKWYRNGTRITQSPGRFLIQQTFIDAMICSLTILELKLRDEGWGVSFKDVCWIFETFQKTKNKTKETKKKKTKKNNNPKTNKNKKPKLWPWIDLSS